MDAIEVLEAVEFAVKAHAGQVRKYALGEPEPYVAHCIRVAHRTAWAVGAARDSYKAWVVTAALLHDVLEDCPQIFTWEIESKFGHRVLDLVCELTDTPKTTGQTRAERKTVDRERLATVSDEAKIIKCADLLDNLPSIMRADADGFGKVFMQEVALLLPLLKVGNRIYVELVDMVNSYNPPSATGKTWEDYK